MLQEDASTLRLKKYTHKRRCLHGSTRRINIFILVRRYKLWNICETNNFKIKHTRVLHFMFFFYLFVKIVIRPLQDKRENIVKIEITESYAFCKTIHVYQLDTQLSRCILFKTYNYKNTIFLITGTRDIIFLKFFSIEFPCRYITYRLISSRDRV